jgi:RecA/RadA recombinase
MPLTGAELLARSTASSRAHSPQASTSCVPLDTLLGGGFTYGAVISMAGESQSGKTLVSGQ